MMFGLTLDDAVFGTQAISNVWISDDESGCYYTATDVPELTIEENAAQDLGTGPLEGSFTAELSPSSIGDCTDTRTVSGNFMAAICAQ